MAIQTGKQLWTTMPMTEAVEEKLRILQPGHNCWIQTRACRAAFLIDAESYFLAFRSAARSAEKTIFIIGWDIDSRIELLRNNPGDGLPVALGDFLLSLVEHQPSLNIYILLWDYTLFFGLNREWFPEFKLGDKVHDRLHLLKDNYYPVGSSHHQKIVVIDDTVAFVGGIDLTRKRWDRKAHAPNDPNRIDPDCKHYRPTHDIQLLVSGNTAAALGELARSRWHRVAQQYPGVIARRPANDHAWPAGIEADLRNVAVGISRTEPPYETQHEVREIEQLYLDSIAAAHDNIYIENQYLTAPKIISALCHKLREENGPEILIILPLQTDSWLSQISMDLLRGRAIQDLRQADRHSRLLVCYPHHRDLTTEAFIKVHSKVMIVDNTFVRIGSSNLNNRSMGLDTECDLAIESGGRADVQTVIGEFRNRLLAHHLGLETEPFHDFLATRQSVLQTVRHFSDGARSLQELEVKLTKAEEIWLESRELLDLERPLQPFAQYRDMLPLPDTGTGNLVSIPLAVFVTVVIGAALSWYFLPLEQLFQNRDFLQLLETLKDNELAPLFLAGVYIVGGLVIVPVTLLISLTILIYGPVQGAAYALAGSLLNALCTYAAGAIMGKRSLKKLTGRYLDKVNRLLASKGIAATFIVRIVPVAPFSIINMLAGASRLSLVDYLLGTLLGMTPGILAIAGLIDRGVALVSEPDIFSLLVFIGLVSCIAFFFWWLKKWLSRHREA